MIASWVLFLVRKTNGSRAYGSTIDRFHWHFEAGTAEIRVEFVRDRLKPHLLSREEMYSMFKLVRENEIRMGWKVPEPDMDPPTLSAEVLELQILGFMSDLDNSRLNALAQFANSLHERKV